MSGSFNGLSASSLAGTTTQVSQKEQIVGSFSSTASAPGGKTETRTSNFGTKYDLNMQAAKGSLPTGMVGYYVNPNMATPTVGAIQGGVNAAQSGDNINAAAGTYKENVVIDKSLAVKGAGVGSTIVDGNKAGSVFTMGKNDPNVDVSLSGMTITNGMADAGGGIYNVGKLTLNNVLITGNTAGQGGGVYNGNLYGGSFSGGTVTMNNGSIAGNSAAQGGGICNVGDTVNLNGGSITGNTANYYGGGIYSSNSQVTFDGTQVAIKSNKAHLPSPSELSWYQGWGVYIDSYQPPTTPPTMTNGFNPEMQVTGNTQI